MLGQFTGKITSHWKHNRTHNRKFHLGLQSTSLLSHLHENATK